VAVDSNRNLYEIDRATGAKTLIGVVSANAGTTGALAVGASNTVYLTSSSVESVFTLVVASGKANLIGAYGDPAVVLHGLEFVGATNTLYGLSSHNNGLYVINQATGAATLIGTSTNTSFTNLGWNSITGTMYATNSGTDSLYTIDLATGAATLVGPLNGPTNPNGVAFDPDTGILYMVDNNTDTFYTINMATGAATAIGSTGTGNLLGLAYINGSIPVELMGLTVE
jgi:sugar lactone lactonase YvrE